MEGETAVGDLQTGPLLEDEPQMTEQSSAAQRRDDNRYDSSPGRYTVTQAKDCGPTLVTLSGTMLQWSKANPSARCRPTSREMLPGGNRRRSAEAEAVGAVVAESGDKGATGWVGGEGSFCKLRDGSCGAEPRRALYRTPTSTGSPTPKLPVLDWHLEPSHARSRLIRPRGEPCLLSGSPSQALP